MSRKHTMSLGQRLAALFGLPFRNLPPPYGDTVPPELRVFEAEADEAQHHPRDADAPPQPHHASSKPRKVGSGNKPLAA